MGINLTLVHDYQNLAVLPNYAIKCLNFTSPLKNAAEAVEAEAPAVAGDAHEAEAPAVAANKKVK